VKLVETALDFGINEQWRVEYTYYGCICLLLHLTYKKYALQKEDLYFFVAGQW